MGGGAGDYRPRRPQPPDKLLEWGSSWGKAEHSVTREHRHPASTPTTEPAGKAVARGGSGAGEPPHWMDVVIWMGNPSPPPGAAADERRSPAKRFDRNTRQEDERARGKGHGQGRGANQEPKDPKRTHRRSRTGLIGEAKKGKRVKRIGCTIILN